MSSELTFGKLRKICKLLQDDFEDRQFRDKNFLFRVMDESGNMYSSVEDFMKYQKGNKK